MTTRPTIPQAATISCRACAHGNVHVELRDKSGAVFARATMPVQAAVPFGSDFTDCCEHAMKANAIGGECKGEA